MVEHVLGAEESYLVGLGSRRPAEPEALRNTIRAALAARSRNEEVADPNRVTKRWSPRYFVRRAVWHTLDHAWEIEDRSGS
jgi:hypothetical protein